MFNLDFDDALCYNIWIMKPFVWPFIDKVKWLKVHYKNGAIDIEEYKKLEYILVNRKDKFFLIEFYDKENDKVLGYYEPI